MFSMLGTIVSAFVPALLGTAALIPHALFQGQLWRAFTWPFVDGISIWTMITWLVLFYFGNFIEGDLGRNRMAKLYVGLWAIITVSHTLCGILLPGGTAVVGLSMIQLVIILLFIAESPNRRFFFGIPAWVLGAVIVGLQLLNLISLRLFGSLLALLLSLAGAAVLARTMGLLSNLDWIPGASSPRPAPQRAPRPPSRREQAHQAKAANDEERMDQLLAKISAEGLHSLTKKERSELEALRQRRKRR